MSSSTDYITLVCVRDPKGKLRVRFHSYCNHEGRTFTNVYDNRYNCQFPTDIRAEGALYRIGSHDLSLMNNDGKKPFYRVNRANIVRLPPDAVAANANANANADGTSDDLPQVFLVQECVICMNAPPEVVFLPCAHVCACVQCTGELRLRKRMACCPLCRRDIIHTLDYHPEE